MSKLDPAWVSSREKCSKSYQYFLFWVSTTRLLCESLLLFWGNFVARHRKRLAYQPKLCMFDNVKNKYVGPQSQVHVKYLGVLIDHNISWKYHIDSIVTKLIKMLGYLQSMYKSLINPYLTYGLAAWGQACKTYLNKILILQKRAVFVLRGLAWPCSSFISRS